MLANSRKYFAPPLPERKSERRKVLIDQARLLNQAKGWGAPRIKNVFDNAFGSDMEWGQRSVSTWIGKSSIEPELDQYWRPWNSRSKTDDAGHLMRLDLVKRSATMYRLLDVMGLFATAISGVVMFRLVHSAGPSFLSLTNYLIPLYVLLLGTTLLGEKISSQALVALGLIVSGIAVSEWRRHRDKPTEKPLP